MWCTLWSMWKFAIDGFDPRFRIWGIGMINNVCRQIDFRAGRGIYGNIHISRGSVELLRKGYFDSTLRKRLLVHVSGTDLESSMRRYRRDTDKWLRISVYRIAIHPRLRLRLQRVCKWPFDRWRQTQLRHVFVLIRGNFFFRWRLTTTFLVRRLYSLANPFHYLVKFSSSRHLGDKL